METYGEEIIEMVWRCKHCKTVCPGVSGNEDESLKCVHCGAQKSDEPWLMPDDIGAAPAITDARQLAFARAGANWRCEYCGCEERNLHGECSVCAAQKPQQPVVTAAKAESPEPAVSGPIQSSPTTPLLPDCGTQDGSHLLAVAGRKLLLVLCTMIFAGVSLGFVRWALSPNVSEASVSGLAWSRTERLFEERTYAGNGWASGMPSGAFNVSCEVRLRGYVSCNPHNCNPYVEQVDCNCTGGDTYRCNPHTVTRRCNCTGGGTYRCNPRRGTCRSNGNGTATCPTVWDTCRTPETCQQCSDTVYETCRRPRVCQRCPVTRWRTCYDQCPVNERYCSYQFNRWEQRDVRTFSGTDRAPRWPGLVAHAPRQRVDRAASYSVALTERGGEHRWTLTPTSERDFLRYDLMQQYRVEWTRAGAYRVLGRIP